jgi:hypothetical protein
MPSSTWCTNCSCRQPFTTDHAGQQALCSLCKQPVSLSDDPDVCPASPKGHNPYRGGDGRWTCSRCNAPVSEPENADVVDLGRFSR